MTTYAGLYGPEALIDGSGHPITSATIDVFTHGTTTHVSLYQDNARVTPLTNPVPNGVDGSTAGRGLDTYGNLSFYIDPGRYDLRIATGAGTRTVEIEIETDPAENAASVSSAFTLSTQSGTTYTFTLSDAGSGGNSVLTEFTAVTAVTATIPPHSSVAFPVGAILPFSQSGAGQVTVTAGAGVTLRIPNGAKTAQQWSQGTAIQRAQDDWIVSGDTAL